ncbi:MAG TPA: tetratricopeptide repeat protein [Spirochaetales bacterium]|nr:tetratricopeptide repeat protein [Spirochaetales bacterium]HRY53051.1 tetratricopeptide repeat protein [Spirochaetia bacterium]
MSLLRQPRPGRSGRPGRLRPAPLALALCSLLGSCSRFSDFAAIASGNRLHARGRFQDAAAEYLSVREESFGPTVDYDLGNVYARLGEYKAAAPLYERARRSGSAPLRADAHYNEGVALYERGRYEESWGAFKEALRLYLAEPRSFDPDLAPAARRNLELAWKAWKKRSLVPPASISPSQRSEGGTAEEELSLLRRLETGRWRPGAAKAPAELRGDY